MYENVAKVYDRLMSEIDYDAWYLRYRSLMELSRPMRRVVEIGCGTGNFTSRFIRDYDVHAVDNSISMLEIAKSKRALFPRGHALTFEQADMACFEGNGEKFDAAVAIFDVMNCALDVETLERVCVHVASQLRRGGRFLFDVNTETAFRMRLFDEEYEDVSSGYSHVWRGEYDPVTRLEHITMKYYRDGVFWFSEQQTQRAHDAKEIRHAMRRAGFERIEIDDAQTMTRGTSLSDRWMVSGSLKDNGA